MGEPGDGAGDQVSPWLCRRQLCDPSYRWRETARQEPSETVRGAVPRSGPRLPGVTCHRCRGQRGEQRAGVSPPRTRAATPYLGGSHSLACKTGVHTSLPAPPLTVLSAPSAPREHSESETVTRSQFVIYDPLSVPVLSSYCDFFSNSFLA